ncbi:MAG: hypothetical protein ACE3JK_18165 [Sporolactobacillus sp.]
MRLKKKETDSREWKQKYSYPFKRKRIEKISVTFSEYPLISREVEQRNNRFYNLKNQENMEGSFDEAKR